MSETQALLHLNQSQALMLFEFLSRFSQDGRLAIEHQAEERVLWDLCAILERQLVEPLRPDYDQLLRKARDLVADPLEPDSGHGAG